MLWRGIYYCQACMEPIQELIEIDRAGWEELRTEQEEKRQSQR